MKVSVKVSTIPVIPVVVEIHLSQTPPDRVSDGGLVHVKEPLDSAIVAQKESQNV